MVSKINQDNQLPSDGEVKSIYNRKRLLGIFAPKSPEAKIRRSLGRSSKNHGLFEAFNKAIKEIDNEIGND